MSSLQPKEHLRGFALRVKQLLVNDLTAISAEKRNECLGGCARSALNMVAECAALNGAIAHYLQTGEMKRLPPDEREAFLNSFDTLEKTLAFLDERTDKLLEAYAALDESTLGEMSDQPFGRPMSRFAVAELPAMHMMYHDGQLNYIQTLHGDSEIHWG